MILWTSSDADPKDGSGISNGETRLRINGCMNGTEFSSKPVYKNAICPFYM